MENSEFDNFFKNKMKGVEAPDFSDQEWNKLVARLDLDEPKGGLGGMSRIIMGLGLLLLLSNLFWGWMWYQNSARVSKTDYANLRYEQEANTSQSANNKVVVSTDTIYRTVVVHQYDTIHHYVKYHHAIGEKSAIAYAANNKKNTQTAHYPSTNTPEYTENLSPALSQTPTEKAAPMVNLSDIKNISSPSNSPEISTNSNAPESAVTTERINAQNRQCLTPVPNKEITPVNALRKLHLEYVSVPMPKVHKKRVDVLSMITPKSVSLGATFGLHNLSDNLLHESEGRTYGLVATLGINKHLDMTITGLYTKNEFGGKQYDKRLGLPDYMPPSEMYDFRYFEVEGMGLASYQLGLGLRYGFAPQKKLNPILGLAYTNQWSGSYEIEMEYTHKITGEGYEEFFNAESTKTPNGFVEPQVGFVYNKSKHWKIEALGYFQQKVLTSTLGVKQNWGLRSSLLYQF